MGWVKTEKTNKLSKLGDIDFTTTAPVDGNALVYDETNDVWVPGAGGSGGGLEVVVLTQAEYDILSTAEKNNGKMYLVNDTGKVLEGTLEAGSTSITFDDAAIKSNSMIDVYTTIFGANPTAATSSVGTVTLYFNSQATDMGVKVVII